jgi:hypothetical protein
MGRPLSQSSRRNGRGEDRTAVVILFGMMNWLYTWYNPKIDGGADELTEQMTAIFLHGLFHGSVRIPPPPVQIRGQSRYEVTFTRQDENESSFR